MIGLIYNLFLTILLILIAPYFVFRAIIDKQFRKELIQKMGFFPSLPFKESIWIHAASVGEIFCSLPLIKKIKNNFPQSKIILTTMTRMGYEQAKTIPEMDLVLFLPIDHPFCLRKSLSKIKPHLLLIAETEFWPNLLLYSGRKGIPIVLFNGRVSEKSFRWYLRFRFFFKRCLKHVSIFLMQTEEDRRRLIEMGVSIDQARVIGNLKFDQTLSTFLEEESAEITKSLQLLEKEVLLIAGSTHSGEEEILIRIFKDLRESHPHLVLILAPRHIERLEEIEQVLKKESLVWRRKTLLSSDQRSARGLQGKRPEVILLDTMGELINLYRLGTLVFIGGTLVPVGGHNPLEPLFFKKCVLFGPHMFHFQEISHKLTEEGGAIQVAGEEDLALQLRRLLSDEKARNEIGERGFQFLQRHRGVTERVFEHIRPFLVS